jgi:hypothetical protein
MFDTESEHDGFKNFETKYLWENYFSKEDELEYIFELFYDQEEFDNMEQIQKEGFFDSLWDCSELSHDLASRYCENVDFKAIADRLTYMYLKHKGMLSE